RGELADVIRQEWQCDPAAIADLLVGRADTAASRLLGSILSGPIDIDKMDYLSRDSLHAGVPYGRNFDQARLIGSLCLNAAGDGLAITSKGRTAAEMMVFARYVMFSEVYWHHSVRAATSMFQRAFFSVFDQLDLQTMWRLDEHTFVQALIDAARDRHASKLLDGLFGSHRRLYKRWLEYSYLENSAQYGVLTHLPYARLVEISAKLADLLSARLKREVLPEHVLIDAPPTKLEVQFKVDVYDPKRASYDSLVDISPVVRALAETQFDDYVKRVRVFLHPEIVTLVREQIAEPNALLLAATER
ncbi:MAG: metal-dependent phosphohydrolase, partial [Planctomycetales bacterium]|nr:metal-dependent phosphohydrolase [Planctomycetales bacterium]